MARLTFLDTGKTLTEPTAVGRHLDSIGIRYETWGIDRLPADLRGRNLTDPEKQQVLKAFGPDIDRLKRERGYATADVVSLYPDTPNLDVICAKFDKRHLHSDDEVRFIVQGRGVFRLFPAKGPAIDAELHPGDFISVPAGFHHLFVLCEDRKITAIRLFTDAAGWVAQYVDAPASATG